jgi:Fe-S oxidoreductase
MCPSFMATRNETDTTRARANVLREFLTHSTKLNRFDHKEIKEVMDLCLSCKGCKSECPSNVDMAKLKAEFLQQYYDANGVPFRSQLIARFTTSASLGALFPGLYNYVMTGAGISKMVKKLSGFAVQRSMPTLYSTTLRSWYKKHSASSTRNDLTKRVYLFCDEFTNYTDVELGIRSILLMEQLGYKVLLTDHRESGRTWLSKGLLRKAKKIANKNVDLLSNVITEDTPLIGIEPSAILSFRDEYLDLVDESKLEEAKRLSRNTFLVEEFLAREMDRGNISKDLFTSNDRTIKLHGHCQQKALNALKYSLQVLSFPKNYKVQVIPSGCCGMAGSFGYEKEHYDISMQIGELVLFPSVREQPDNIILAAPGTSCRHQIKDGTSRKAFHPVEILYEALLER